ncbi:unnamed protein product [Adineta ricciae]|uniref:Uncharacterized protein n=1 Tax=Adineta ricciae TaxID=249248 RepID=A0A815M5Z9_ADIRI|nr:unnamed protein product [Adineta ricciae]
MNNHDKLSCVITGNKIRNYNWAWVSDIRKKPSKLSKRKMSSYKNFIVIVLIAVVFIAVEAMNQSNTSAESKMNVGNDASLVRRVYYCDGTDQKNQAKCRTWCRIHDFASGACIPYHSKIRCFCRN